MSSLFVPCFPNQTRYVFRELPGFPLHIEQERESERRRRDIASHLACLSRVVSRDISQAPGLGCSKDGWRYSPDKSQTSGLCNWSSITYPLDSDISGGYTCSSIQLLNNRGQIESLFPGYTGNEFSPNRGCSSHRRELQRYTSRPVSRDFLAKIRISIFKRGVGKICQITLCNFPCPTSTF